MMKTKLFATLSLILIALAALTACGASAATQAPGSPAEPGLVVEEKPAAPANDLGYAGAPAVAQEAEKSALPMPTSGVTYQTVPDVDNAPGNASYAERMIVKNAEVNVLVKDSDVAIDRLTQVVSDAGGYIVSSRIWYQPYEDGENYKYASITLGIPVDQFEVTMRRVRGLAIRVLDENASGEDVTDQFVDLQSRLTNLEATQERIKGFLEDAKSVDEALRINQELAQIEAQIEEVKGRMKYLSDRSAFSTITVTVTPDLPVIEPAPAPTPKPWTPSETLKDAAETLVKAYQGIIEFGIWVFVAVLPILVPPALLIWLFVKLLRRKPNREPASSES
jgi:copper chaperone CopZ